MAWQDTIDDLATIQASLEATKTDSTAEAAKTTAAELAALSEKARMIADLAADISRKAEEQRTPSTAEVLKDKLRAICADKEHKETAEYDHDGFIATIAYESAKVATKIVQTWLYSDETINRGGAGTRLEEVVK
jgi:hypothetical protein